MNNNVCVCLKSGKNVNIDDFKYITYPNNDGSVVIKNLKIFIYIADF